MSGEIVNRTPQQVLDMTQDARAEFVAKAFVGRDAGKGANPAMVAYDVDETGAKKSDYSNLQTGVIKDLKSYVKQAESLRKGGVGRTPLDISFGNFMADRCGIASDATGSMDNLFSFLGISPNSAKIEDLMSMPEFNEDFKWLVPEIYRDAIRTGLERVPIYNSLISQDVPVSQTSVIMPEINRANTKIGKVRESETIPMGHIAFKQKTVKIFKVGTGLEITDEVRQYVSINMISEYLDHVGMILGMGLDTLAVDVLVNGDNEGTAGNTAPVIGVENIGQIDWNNDLSRLAIRMAILGHQADVIVAGEDNMRDILNLPEIKGFAGETTSGTAGIQVRTPITRNYNMLPSGAMPANSWLFVDPRKALIKLTAKGLMVESDRIIQNQTNITTVTTTTGFGKLFQDASILMDSTQAFASQGFPAYMNSLANNLITF